LNNISRVTIQALSAVLGGTQSLHTNGYDEALSLPTESAAGIALRTQQIIAHESGVTHTVDPLGGSFFIETLTDQLEEEAWKYIDRIDAMGGAVQAIESGFMQNEIANSAYKYQQEIERKEKIIVGMNQFTTEEEIPINIFRVDDSIRSLQIEKLKQLKSARNASAVVTALEKLEGVARAGENVMPSVIEAVESYVTLGEIADALRKVFGEHKV
jgi:methylmalonyl-CoA mutase N-terminal domain/subunit